jgi:hypothetical protein
MLRYSIFNPEDKLSELRKEREEEEKLKIEEEKKNESSKK